MSGKILLTGAGGQLGREIAARANPNLPVHGVTRGMLDIADRDAVLRLMDAVNPAIVINAAAYTAVDKAESEPAEAFRVNREGPARLAEACTRAGIPLIHFSTDYVFDGGKSTAYVEDDPTGPLNVYGESKLAGEMAVRELCPRHVILRTSWLYGTGGNNFVATILRLAREQDSLRVVDDQTGGPTFAGDLAEAALAVASRLGTGATNPRLYGTFHCSGSGTTTWHGFASKIVELAEPATGRKPPVRPIATADYPRPARRPSNSSLDCEKLLATYGVSLRPWQTSLREALSTMLAVAPPDKIA